MSNLILSLSLIFTLSFVVSARAADDAANSKSIEGCEGFSAEQLDKDPNAPCFAAIRLDLNEKDSVGIYYDPQLTPSSRDESGGKHVQTDLVPADDTNNNIYNMSFLKSAVTPSGSGNQGKGGSEGGTD